MHYMEFQIAMTLSLSNSFNMTTKRPFPYIILVFEQFNMLQLFVSLVLNVSLLLGTADAEILRSPLLKNQS